MLIFSWDDAFGGVVKEAESLEVAVKVSHTHSDTRVGCIRHAKFTFELWRREEVLTTITMASLLLCVRLISALCTCLWTGCKFRGSLKFKLTKQAD